MELFIDRLAFSVIPLLVLLGTIVSYEELRRYRQLQSIRQLRRKDAPAFKRDV